MFRIDLDPFEMFWSPTSTYVFGTKWASNPNSLSSLASFCYSHSFSQSSAPVSTVDADECARVDHLFEETARKNKFRLESRVAESPLIDKIREEIVFPPGILSQEFFDYARADISKRERGLFPLPQQWSFPVRVKAVEVGSIYLYNTWRTYMTSTDRTDGLLGIYFLIAGILHLTETTHQTIYGRVPPPSSRRLYPVLALPACPYKVLAPIAILLILPEEWRDRLRRISNSYAFSSELDASDQNIIILPWCINFSDDEKSSRQIAFSLCSVQNQFRALGLRDVRAFGGTLFEHKFRFYVSEWVGDEVVVNPTKHILDISSFPDYLHLYVVIFKLVEESFHRIDSMLAKWEREGLPKEVWNATAYPWRPPPPERGGDEDEG